LQSLSIVPPFFVFFPVEVLFAPFDHHMHHAHIDEQRIQEFTAEVNEFNEKPPKDRGHRLLTLFDIVSVDKSDKEIRQKHIYEVAIYHAVLYDCGLCLIVI
jgi:hypothetical protein